MRCEIGEPLWPSASCRVCVIKRNDHKKLGIKIEWKRGVHVRYSRACIVNFTWWLVQPFSMTHTPTHTLMPMKKPCKNPSVRRTTCTVCGGAISINFNKLNIQFEQRTSVISLFFVLFINILWWRWWRWRRRRRLCWNGSLMMSVGRAAMNERLTNVTCLDGVDLIDSNAK